MAWDLRLPASTPTSLTPPPTDNPFADPPMGPLAAPGEYKVSLAKRVAGKVTPLGEPVTFTATPLGTASLPATDRAALLAFEKKTARLQRAVLGSVRAADEAQTRLDHVKKALLDTPGADPKLGDEARAIETRLKDLRIVLTGDETIGSRNEPTPPSIVDRVQQIVGGHWTTTSAPTQTHRRAYDIAAGQFSDVLIRLRGLIDGDLRRLEESADAAGAPWTPGRVPRWVKE
jgi:hypothetical protein